MRCLNRKVLMGLAAVGLGVWLFAPNVLGAAPPLLLFVACPLSMVFMMRGMSRADSKCQTGRAPGAEERDVEIAHLRAEVDQLRAERVGDALPPAASQPRRATP